MILFMHIWQFQAYNKLMAFIDGNSSIWKTAHSSQPSSWAQRRICLLRAPANALR